MSCPPLGWPGRSPICGTGSIASRRQSSSPTDERENRPSSGGVSLARATLNPDARSGPNQGFACAPSTGLRLVATCTVGLAEISDASKRAPVDAKVAQPPSVSTEAAELSPRSTPRREAAPKGDDDVILRDAISRTITPTPPQPQ